MRVEGYYDWNNKALVRRLNNNVQLVVEINQLQTPEQFKILEVLYG